jgi:alpha-L-arabinofuranosidase
VATRDDAGRALAIAVVTRDRDRDLPATLDFGQTTITGPIEAWEVNGPDVTATNSFDDPRAVDVRERRLAGRGAMREHTLPASSVTVLRPTIG